VRVPALEFSKKDKSKRELRVELTQRSFADLLPIEQFSIKALAAKRLSPS